MSTLPATFVKGVVSLSGLPEGPVPEIAFSGRSNVGKSSLLNLLFGTRKPLAKVSQTPGKTRELNFFRIQDRYHLVDLPGYGYARVPANISQKWQALIRDYLESRRQLAGIVQLVDSRHDPTAQDRDMLEWLEAESIPTLLVATKTDKLKRNARTKALAELSRTYPSMRVIGSSVTNKDGRTHLMSWIDETVAGWSGRRPSARDLAGE